MMAVKKMLDQEPGEIEMLLPFHAAGTLNPRDARRVEEALAGDPELARQYAVIQEEYAETIHLNESLGAPSARAMQKLFAAIDEEPVRQPSLSTGLSTRISQFFAQLSPRTLAWSASLGAVALLLQAGVIGTVLMKDQPSSFQTASLSTSTKDSSAPLIRSLSVSSGPPRVLVQFASDARMSDIATLLDRYQASIVDGPKNGMLRLQFGDRTLSRDEVASLMNRLQSEKIVSIAAPAQ